MMDNSLSLLANITAISLGTISVSENAKLLSTFQREQFGGKIPLKHYCIIASKSYVKVVGC